jgi:hypothetical protein
MSATTAEKSSKNRPRIVQVKSSVSCRWSKLLYFTRAVETEDRPRKKMKMEHGISPRSTGDDSLPTLKTTPSPSFDSSLATLKDEEDSAARKEFEEIAVYATDRVMEYAKEDNKDKPVTSVTVDLLDITEDNLWTLHNMVKATGLSTRPTSDICDILMEASKRVEVDGEVFKTMPIERFHISLNELLGGVFQEAFKARDRCVFVLFC